MLININSQSQFILFLVVIFPDVDFLICLPYKLLGFFIQNITLLLRKEGMIYNHGSHSQDLVNISRDLAMISGS